MNKVNIVGFIVINIFVVFNCQAELSVCELQNIEIPNSVAAAQVTEYNAKLDSECKLSTKYKQVRTKLQEFDGVVLTDINLYQAMRFVQRSWYDTSKAAQIPIQKTYQVKKEDYLKPISERSTVIWDNWEIGIKQLEPLVLAKATGAEFTFEELRNVHRGFFTLSDEQGDFAHRPDPGLVKAPNENDNPWWDFKSVEEAEQAQIVVNELNEDYKAMGLVANFEGGVLAKNPTINFPLQIKKTNDIYSIYSGDSRANPILIKNLFKFINVMMTAARQKTHMIWNGRLMTPFEVAAFAQQFYVAIHPFSEGNGRTSRFIQEFILSSFDLPHGSSGDLMDYDVLTNHQKYYTLAFARTYEQLFRLENCVDAYKDLPKKERNRLKSADLSQLNYDCQLIKNQQ